MKSSTLNNEKISQIADQIIRYNLPELQNEQSDEYCSFSNKLT